MTIQIKIAGVEVSFDELEDDLNVARTHFGPNEFAFTANTVQGLMNKIIELNRIINPGELD